MNTSYASQIDIDYRMMEEHPDYPQYAIENMKREGAIKIFEEIYKAGTPIVIETHIESWDDPNTLCRRFRLHYRLTAVQTRNITMPVFEYTNHLGEREWKCSSCGMINKISATYCGEMHIHAVGCGSPREFTQ